MIPRTPGTYEKYIKRALDVIISFFALLFLSPLMLIFAVLIRINLGSPIIFKQARPGKNGKIFTLYKFRTMTDAKDADGNLLSDSERLTGFGQFLRKTSADELPELFNILCGSMSFVGPRPLLVKYLPLYNEHQSRRHDVTPGLTGWAQVNGRNAIGWNEKFDLDVWYTQNISFALDVRIFFMTVKKVFAQEDISSDTSVTMEEFQGNAEVMHE